MSAKRISLSSLPARSRSLKDSDGTVLLHYSLEPYTLPDLPRRSGRRISHYHQAVDSQWRTHWETSGLSAARTAYNGAYSSGTPFHAHVMSLKSEITYFSPPYLSICQDAREDCGDGRPVIVRSSVTWDIRAGYPLPLSHFFPNQHTWKKTVIDAICTEGRRRVSSGEYLMDEPVEEALIQAFSPDRFFLTPSGLYIFYPLCSVSAYAEGLPSFLVPTPCFPLFDPCIQAENEL